MSLEYSIIERKMNCLSPCSSLPSFPENTSYSIFCIRICYYLRLFIVVYDVFRKASSLFNITEIKTHFDNDALIVFKLGFHALLLMTKFSKKKIK